jgi:hypothetical protein
MTRGVIMPYPEGFQQLMKPADIVAFINGKMVEYHYASKDENAYNDRKKWPSVGEYLGQGYIGYASTGKHGEELYHFWRRIPNSVF